MKGPVWSDPFQLHLAISIGHIFVFTSFKIQGQELLLHFSGTSEMKSGTESTQNGHNDESNRNSHNDISPMMFEVKDSGVGNEEGKAKNDGLDYWDYYSRTNLAN